MLKRLLLVMAMLIAFSGAAFADQNENAAKPVIAAFLEAPVTYVNNEDVQKLVPDKVKALFTENQFAVLPFDTCQMALRTYKEDNHMIYNQYYSQPVNRQDIQKIAQGLNANYALFIIISNDAPRYSGGLFTHSFKTTVTCDVRLLDVAGGNYLVSKQIVRDGSSSSFVLGMPSFDNAYNDALKKALDDLTLDTAALIK